MMPQRRYPECSLLHGNNATDLRTETQRMHKWEHWLTFNWLITFMCVQQLSAAAHVCGGDENRKYCASNPHFLQSVYVAPERSVQVIILQRCWPLCRCSRDLGEVNFNAHSRGLQNSEMIIDWGLPTPERLRALVTAIKHAGNDFSFRSMVISNSRLNFNGILT